MNLNFSQMITMHCPEPQKLIELITQWDVAQATSDIMGYMGTRILADRQNLGRYVLIADFGVIDPAVSAAAEAARNNERPETKAIAAAMARLVDGALEYHNYDEVYRTDQ
jgi:hypothetical protein